GGACVLSDERRAHPGKAFGIGKQQSSFEALGPILRRCPITGGEQFAHHGRHECGKIERGGHAVAGSMTDGASPVYRPVAVPSRVDRVAVFFAEVVDPRLQRRTPVGRNRARHYSMKTLTEAARPAASITVSVE